MHSDANYQKIALYLLLSFLCSGSVFSATIETGSKVYEVFDAARQGNDEDEGIYSKDEDGGIYSENEDASFLDFLTTTKLYTREERTVPTTDPVECARSSLFKNLSNYLCSFILITAFVVLMGWLIYMYLTIERNLYGESPSHLSTSSDRFVAVHRSTEQSDFFPEVHRPVTGRNQVPYSGRECCGEPVKTDLFSKLDSNRGAADTLRVAISFINSASPNSDRRESDVAVTEMSPVHSSVVAKDLTNPTKPAFPVV
ncbi:hypothetical protein AVEN_67982-1 [Araneus ventricosus]|uniref:SEA domain-containing protein n=1 Tax=Araneus ventricosus TaxID=182803 RepID=A0A4Y2SWD9_ARAVE|nr:hypothetical protein AVEN_67982-1 [Araneus ventricosus]